MAGCTPTGGGVLSPPSLAESVQPSSSTGRQGQREIPKPRVQLSKEPAEAQGSGSPFTHLCGFEDDRKEKVKMEECRKGWGKKEEGERGVCK